ncbi:putative sortase family protein [Lachnospiraceae bacterium TWA4]|nr:putative sortase family protein [Lachnospiraceae bacterium TWA4]
MRNKVGTIFTILGLLLIVAALSITIYNIYDENRAEEAANELLDHWPDIPKDTPDIPDYILDPTMDMPTKMVNGVECIGQLEIPVLNLKLPIISEWSYPKLRIAPCRFSGSAYLNNLVIAAHNYRRQFASLKELRSRDQVFFIDMAGNTFRYQVVDIEILNPTDVEKMVSGNWDLTLFTCTIGGQTRITIRCNRVDE